MRTYIAEWTAQTLEVPDFVDVSDEVQDALTSSGIDDGQVTVFCPDSSCVLIVNEKEGGLLADIRQTLERLGIRDARGRTMLGSASVVLPAAGGKLRLGMWQRLLLVELEEASARSVVAHVIGE